MTTIEPANCTRALRPLAPGVALLALVALGCGDDSASPGTLELSIYGEDFIEQGIPAAEVADGWAVRFDSFLVTLTDLSVARGHGAPSLTDSNQRIFDIARPSMKKGITVISKMVDGGKYDHIGYAISPARTGAAAGNPLPAGALEAMIAAGESVRVSGSGSKDGKTVSFTWGFTGDTTHSCHIGLEVDGGTSGSQITIHGDHLFYDDLVSMEPGVRFDLVAASDADMDGTVTRTELTARDIRGQARYQVGNVPVTTLWAFIAHQATTLGHIDGEGHCQTAAR
jgi:hypothetical protein